MTRWLDDDEQRTWRNFLAATQMVGEALDRQLQRDSGMPHTYYMILVALSEAERRSMRMSELAARAQCSQSRLSHAVARLEERGWVRRSRSESDRRGNVALLTDDGFAALAEAAPGHVEEVRQRLFDALTPEQIRALDEICTAVRSKTVGGSS
ncbi:MarR family winged helix-turn-helix transcriptional regulator [Nonomuraea sp. NBC_01738]|uniref:MarR family winged helix-turn-helix transcriptional regulator n=1 Tax=Nonomuraea sp. NBC_01738 TaxID=2976003 RepID=UPI002E15E0BE|nr:MarR family winged helix-turn-helix transcriptional regulator [Nonomuraea sp. NBC_01738]